MGAESAVKLPIQLPKCSWAANDLITAFPSRVPLEFTVESKRTFVGYEEWRISFVAEPSSGLPDPRLAQVSAYLLVPHGGDFRPPFPAMVCFHQCGRDCDIGKESVIGKISQRPDQAYGLELAQQGFVVLAPDSINCGERIVEQLRTPGAPPDQWSHRNCWSALDPFIPWGPERWKKVWDGIRSVDALWGLSFVDRDRIGVIGHSMGSSTAIDTCIADARIKACVISPGGCSSEDRALLAPRLLIQQQGALDTTAADLGLVEAAQDSIQRRYRSLGYSGDLVNFSQVEHGHHFSDEFKVYAYARLRRHFGMVPQVEEVVLYQAVESALQSLEDREDLWWSWPNRQEGSRLPRVVVDGDCAVSAAADPKALGRGLEALLVPMMQKIPHGSDLTIKINHDKDNAFITMSLQGGAAAAIVAHEPLLREAPHHIASCGGSLTKESDPSGFTYTVSLPKSDR